MYKNLYLRLKHQLPLIIITLIITFSFLLEKAGAFHWPVMDKVENFLYDMRIIATMPNDIDTRIVIVDIDEKSLAEVGRWPWSRNQVARLVNELFNHYNVSLVGFDIVFPEPDESSGLKILQVLGRDQLAGIDEYKKIVNGLEEQLDFDKLLAKSIKNNRVILGYYFNDENFAGTSTTSGDLPAPAFSREMFKNKNVSSRRATGYNANIEILQNAALGAGHFSPWLDDDGVVRRVPLLYEYQGNFYESLSLVMIRNLLEIKETIPVFEQDYDTPYPSLERLSLEYLQVPVDDHIQALVPYRGREKSFSYVSATDVIHGRVKKEELQDVIVLVGTTAPGLFDLRTTPVQKQYPGVEIHANLIAGILDEEIKQSPAYIDGIEFIQLLTTGILLCLLLPLLSPLWGAFSTLAIALITIGINLSIWQMGNLVMPLASSLILIAIIFVINMSYGFFIERRGKLQIASTFGQYIPPELIDEMNFDPESYTLDAESREMTVLFSDVRSFTTISEGLDPKDLSELMNAYLTPMTKIIHENRGTIDKYIGDAIMAFWGAPVDNDEHARFALKTAMEMLERLEAIREEFIERGWPPLYIGIGLNTGTMSVGNMGSEFRLSYTVLGDAVNLGARLEGLTKNYGVELVVSETTKQAVPEYIYRKLDFVAVKGKNEPVAIYEPVALEDEISELELEEIALCEKAQDAYQNQNWDWAKMLFDELKDIAPDRLLYDIYLDRIASFKENPPPEDWDGVFVHKTK
jgi:adenylate cyclase